MDTPALLLGRDRELSIVDAAVGAGQPLLLTGEAGIGKTTILSAASDGRRSFVGGALGLLTSVPYLAIRRAFRWSPDGEPGLVAREVMQRAADGLVVLDDLQWADAGTLEVAALLAHRLPLLTAVRSGGDRAEAAIAGLRSAGFQELRLGPLDETDAIALAQEHGDRLSEVQARRLVEHVGGNPLLISELARSGVTTSLRLSIAHQIRPLDAETRHLLEVLAVARRPIAIGSRRREIGMLVEAGFATRRVSGYEIRHALIAEAVEATLSDDDRRSRHAEIARLVRDPAERARHLAAAGRRREAASLALRLAAESQPGLRAALLAIAAENEVGPAATTRRLEAAEALEAAKMDADVERILADLPASGDEAEARAQVILTSVRWRLGDSEGAHRAIERATELIGGTGTALEARLLSEHAWIRAVERDGAAAVAIAARAVAILNRLGASACRAMHVEAVALMLDGAPEAAYWGRYEAALLEARETGDRVEEVSILRHMVGTDEALGRLEDGRRRGELAVRLAREAGLIAEEHRVRASLITLFNSAGDYLRVVAETEALLVEPIARRTRAEVSGYCSIALVDLGRFDDARAMIDTELEQSVDDLGGRFDLLWGQGELALASGDARKAAEIAAKCAARFDGADYPDLVFARLIGMWAALELGEDVGPVIDLDAGHAALWHGAAPESAGIRQLASSDHEAAAESFKEAAGLYAPYHRRSEMRVRWAHGEALRRAGQRDAARAVLEAAEERADELHMLPLLAKIRRSLRLAGVRRAAPRTTTGRLTGREREVLTLVASGLTNAQIATRLGLGRPTVARIVASASGKLGATSRMQAALEAIESGS
jgi:DNA-binding CsgD family transcriptional regulator